MQRVAIISSDDELNKKIMRDWPTLGDEFKPEILTQRERCFEFLMYELPELCIFNFSDDNLNISSLLYMIKRDPWLQYGGIVGVYNSEDEEDVLSRSKDINIVGLINSYQFDFHFNRLLRIIRQNRQILFQRHIQRKFLPSMSGEFVIDNDPFDLHIYSHLMSHYLFTGNFISRETREYLHIALMELLMNAVEHGNCKISFEEKTKWLQKENNIFDLIREKNKIPEINSKKVYLKYRIKPEKTFFSIKDQGSGFDWLKHKDAVYAQDQMNLHGRGIKMADHYVSNLTYNQKGNEVFFECEHQKNTANPVPAVFGEAEEVVFHDNQVVFQENEHSNFLYYIVKGKLNIFAQGEKISTLTPADIFLGEMSFLLHDKRSATVKSEGTTTLIKISKTAFIKAIKREPHHSIFIARLLAERLQRLNILQADLL
jgi:anti-sigma regulatory factor (Ser/Thr protein kinase)